MSDEGEIDNLMAEIEDDPDRFLIFAIHIAVFEGNIPRIEKLLSYPETKFGLKARLPYGETPLHVAVLRGNVEVVKYLLRKMNEKNVVYGLTRCDENPLHFAYRELRIAEHHRQPIRTGNMRKIVDLLISNGIGEDDEGLFVGTPIQCYRRPMHNFSRSSEKPTPVDWELYFAIKYKIHRILSF